MTTYVPGYHWPGSSEMITELFVPRPLLADFLAAAARDLRALEADVVYGTVRLIERDDETQLAWAREPWACVVLNLHVQHTLVGLAQAAEAFRRLIDLPSNAAAASTSPTTAGRRSASCSRRIPGSPPSWTRSSSATRTSCSRATGIAPSAPRWRWTRPLSP